MNLIQRQDRTAEAELRAGLNLSAASVGVVIVIGIADDLHRPGRPNTFKDKFVTALESAEFAVDCTVKRTALHTV